MTSLLLQDMRDFLQSDQQEVPQSIRQLALLLQSDEAQNVAASLITATAQVRGSVGLEVLFTAVLQLLLTTEQLHLQLLFASHAGCLSVEPAALLKAPHAADSLLVALCRVSPLPPRCRLCSRPCSVPLTALSAGVLPPLLAPALPLAAGPQPSAPLP